MALPPAAVNVDWNKCGKPRPSPRSGTPYQTDSLFVTGKLWTNYQQANNALLRNNVNAAHPGLNEAMEMARYNGADYRYSSLNVGETHIFNAHPVNSIRGPRLTCIEVEVHWLNDAYSFSQWTCR